MLSLRLFHGRASPDEQLTDWGRDGPTLGPIESVDITYGGLTLGLPGGELVELQMINGLIFYDDVLYGDLEVLNGRGRMTPVDEAAAEPAPAMLRNRDERGAVALPPAALLEYQRRLQVFVDSIRELAGDAAGESIHRALSNVVRRRRRPGARR